MKTTQLRAPFAIIAVLLLAGQGNVAFAAHELLYAITTRNNVISFYADTPGSILSAHAITGLQGSEKIRGMDFGLNGLLYGLGSSSRLYTINPNTGQATAVGGQFSTLLNGQSFGLNIGTTGVRVVSELGQSLLINTGTGVATVQASPVYAAGDPHFGQIPHIRALAYDSGTGTWIAGDSLANGFATLNPATGVLNSIGPAGIGFSGKNGLDFSPASGMVYLASPAASSDPQANLYTVNPATGAVTLVGLIGTTGDTTLVRALTVGFNPGYVAVVNTNDSGFGSLRDTIGGAISGGTITFAPNVVGTITLTSGELLIDKSLNILGPGANILTVSGNHTSRVFHVANGPVLLANLRIADGYAPGGGGGVAVESGGCVTVSNCTITGCYAAGTDAYGTGGGAISAFGSVCLTVIGSTLSSNSTPADGGGIYLFNGPTVSVTNSTISGNRTLNGFGDGWGGGIFQINGGTLTVTSSTIANNSSVSQGGGLYKGLGGSATIANSLIAGNSALGGPDCQGTFVSSGYNLIGNSSGSTGFGQVGDQLNVNPLLGPLTDNGGPTFTHGLLSGSPAIDKGKSFGLATDQRGRQRPYDFASIVNVTNGFGADIGAYEVNPPSLSIARAGGNVLLSWYSSDNGYTLEAKTTLSPAALWAPVPGTPAIVGSQYVVTNGPATGNKFYRLRSP